MSICLLGEFYGNFDEGMRKVSFYIARELSKNHDVLALDLRHIIRRDFWKSLKKFNPQIIHYIHGSSIKSFMLLKIISRYCKDSRTIMSVIHPNFCFASKLIIPLFKPDLVLVQSYEAEKLFRSRGFKTEFIPCGVDIEKFKPVKEETKKELRRKYGISKDAFTVLHVGSIKEKRNVTLLGKIAKKVDQVLVVGAPSTGIQREVLSKLEKAGCIVWTEYFEYIEEIYSLSDCYVFPTHPANKVSSIEMPLSVLEAMACNLPIITTRFGALPRFFEEGEGFYFADDEGEFISILEKIRNCNVKIATRTKVMRYSWDKVASELEKIYERLIKNI